MCEFCCAPGSMLRAGCVFAHQARHKRHRQVSVSQCSVSIRMTDASGRASEMIEEEQAKPWWQCFIQIPPPQNNIAESQRSFRGARRFLFGDGSHPACSNIEWNLTREEAPGGRNLAVKLPLTSVPQVSTMSTPLNLSHHSCSNTKGNSTRDEEVPGGTNLAVNLPLTSVPQVSTIAVPSTSKIEVETCSNTPDYSNSLLYKALVDQAAENVTVIKQKRKRPTTSSSTRNNYLTMAKTMKNKILHTCPLCDKTAKRKHNLQRHMDTMHTTQINLKPCCGIIFNTKSDSVQHYNNFHKDYGFQCKLCDHIFARPALLKRHMTVHTKEKPFCCLHCSYTCGFKGNMVRHFTRHHVQDYFTDVEFSEDSPDLAALQPEVCLSVLNSDLMQEDLNVSYVHKKLRRSNFNPDSQ